MLTTLHVQRYQGWQDRFCRDIGAGWAKIVNPPLDTPILPNVPRTLIRFWCDDVAAGYISRGYEGGRQFVRDQAADVVRRCAGRSKLELWRGRYEDLSFLEQIDSRAHGRARSGFHVVTRAAQDLMR